MCVLQIVSVDAAAGVLVLGGVDVVDGSPVLDIKPYVPFSDALPDAAAPDWVTVGCNMGSTGSKASLQNWTTSLSRCYRSSLRPAEH
jgi:tRNA (Thr-GGU) A37 N-methylase